MPMHPIPPKKKEPTMRDKKVNILHRFSNWLNQKEAARPKWRDEKSVLNFLIPIIVIGCLGIFSGSKFVKTNIFEYPISIILVMIYYMIGHISGINSGKEIERLFPNCPGCEKFGPYSTYDGKCVKCGYLSNDK